MLFTFLINLIDRFFSKSAILIIKAYRIFISPVLGSNCRFHPTCSEYGLDAFRHNAFFLAAWLLTKRVFKCHPFSAGGHDPIKKTNG